MKIKLFLVWLAFASLAFAQEPGIPVGSGAQAGKCLSRNGSGQTVWVDCSAAGGAVSSVFGRSGAVTAATSDYSWAQIGSKPSTFPPETHGHSIADVTSLQNSLDGKAAAAHGHAISEVTNLQTTLDAKASAVHGHAISDTTGLQTALDGKSATGHGHAIADTTGLQTALDGKSATGHAHAISDTTGLQTALDGKSASGHGHAIADTTGLQTALDGKQASLGFTPENSANKNAASGYAGIDASSKLTGSQQVYGTAANSAAQGNDSRITGAEQTTNKNAASGYAGLTSGTKLTASQGQEVWAVTDLTSYATTSGTGTQAILATITTPAVNNVLTWNGTNWINQAPAGGGESENVVRTTGDVTNSTTTFADVTELTFSATASKDYIFEAWLIFQSNTATTGIKFAVNGPASPAAVVMNAHIPIALTLYASDSMMASRAYDTGTPSVSVDTINANLLAHIVGILRNGTTTGPFAIRFAAETTGIVKVMTGSVLRYRQTN